MWKYQINLILFLLLTSLRFYAVGKDTDLAIKSTEDHTNNYKNAMAGFRKNRTMLQESARIQCRFHTPFLAVFLLINEEGEKKRCQKSQRVTPAFRRHLWRGKYRTRFSFVWSRIYRTSYRVVLRAKHWGGGYGREVTILMIKDKGREVFRLFKRLWKRSVQ